MTTTDARRPGLLATVGILLVAGLAGLEATIAFETYAVTTSLPSVVDALSAPAWYSAAFSGTLIASVTGMVLAGPWCDRVGARPPLLTAIGLFVVGVLMCALAPHIAVFVLGRLVQGVGVGMAAVTIYAIASATVPQEHHPALFGVVNAAWVVPSLAGPVVSGLLTEHLGWRWVYGSVAVVAVLSAAGLLVGLRGRDTRPAGDGNVRIPWGWAVAASAAVLAMSLSGGNRSAWSLLALALSTAAVLAVLTRLLPPGALRARQGVPRLVAMRSLLAACAYTTETYVPLFLQRDRGVSIVLSGLALAGSAVGWAVGAWWQARPRRPGPPSLLPAALLVLCGPVSTGLVVATGWAWWPVSVGVALAGVGMGVAYPQISSQALALSPRREHGRVGSSLQLGEACAVAATLALGGAAQVHLGDGLAWTYAGLAGIGVLAVLVARSARDRPAA
ncbi:MFS transporter [Kytococcus sp. Marseille-QA3725]